MTKITHTQNTARLTASRKALATLALSLAFVAGCAGPKVASPVTAELSGSEPSQQMAFWHTLAERPLTSNDEAFHGLLLFVDGKSAPTYAERLTLLKSKQLLKEDFDEPADQAVRRGTLAIAMVKALQIKGGITLTLLGPTERYAVRELEFQNLLPPSSPHQTLSGSEFVGVIGRMEDHQRIAPTRANERTAGETEQGKTLGQTAKPEAATTPSPAPAPAKP
jgi:hypothetical protein